MSDTFILRRSGSPPLRFSGEMLAESPGRHAAGKEQSRWHDLAAYRTDAGRYVLEVGYRTTWRGERGHDEATVCADPADIARLLSLYDPSRHVVGFPPGGQHAGRQRRLLDDVAARYREQVADLLARLDYHEEADEMAVTSFRASDDTAAALDRLQAVHAYESRTEAIESAVRCWEMSLTLATDQVGAAFSRAEWNCIAEACNGTMWDHLLGGSRPGFMLAAEAEDAWRLGGTGEAWFGGKAADAVASLCAKLRELTHEQGHAVVRAVCFFWSHPDRIDHAADEWWTPAFRRSLARKGDDSR